MTGLAYATYLTTLTGLGLLIGSFLNVVAARVPHGQSVIHPRSACPVCHTTISSRDNIPVLSWLILRGRCRHCQVTIPDRYPLVEIATALTWLGIAVWSWQPGSAQGVDINPLTPTVLAVASIGIALWVIDLDHLRLPDALVLPLYPIILTGLTAQAWIIGQWQPWTPLASAVVWLAVFGGLWIGTQGRGMGFGDVKLAPALGLLLGAVGWGASLTGLLTGFLIGAAVGAVLVLRGRAERRAPIPYGPFMLAGAATGLLWGDTVWAGYLTLLN